MRIYCRFNYYSIEDLTNIVKQRADSLSWKYENDEVLETIAMRSKQTPRLALNRNLQMAYNVSTSEVLNRWRTLWLPIMPPVPVSFHTSLHILPG